MHSVGSCLAASKPAASGAGLGNLVAPCNRQTQQCGQQRACRIVHKCIAYAGLRRLHSTANPMLQPTRMHLGNTCALWARCNYVCLLSVAVGIDSMALAHTHRFDTWSFLCSKMCSVMSRIRSVSKATACSSQKHAPLSFNCMGPWQIKAGCSTTLPSCYAQAQQHAQDDTCT